MVTYFRWPLIVTFTGILLGGWIGWIYTSTLEGALSYAFICAVLGIFEISLSFDNAIVNANKLKTMTPVWQRRFLTWGILIAVFGMRIIFPVAIVSIAAQIGPVAAVSLAISDPAGYAQIMEGAELSILAFGGTFLMMVGLGFFFDAEKEVHWVHFIESRVSRVTGVLGIDTFITLLAVVIFVSFVPEAEKLTAISSALYGLLTFISVKILGDMLDAASGGDRTIGKDSTEFIAKGGFGAFLYLEMLDASFSFDGVIGAFAISQNLFIIAIGLGIGAMYVRSMTIMLVELGTLAEYRYLEHGAFYAILFLSLIMFAQTQIHVPEVITGLFGVGFIGVALLSSVRFKRLQKDHQTHPRHKP